MRKISVILLFCALWLSASAQELSTREQVLEQIKFAEKNFYDVESENYDEEKFIEQISKLLQSPLLTATDRYRPEMLLADAKKNRVGEVVPNITAVTTWGRELELSSIDADYILLFFNDPECESCAAIKNQISQLDWLQKAVMNKKLAIVGIYPFDDFEAWQNAKYPDVMINLWDKSQKIIDDELFVLKQIPSFYLLDSNKRVIKKNCTLSQALKIIESKL